MESNLLKTLLRNNLGSKEEVISIIKEGLVKVNSKVIKDPGYILTGKEKISVGNESIIEKDEIVYYMINKPVGYMSGGKDPLNRKNVYDLIKGVNETIFSVGRMDYDSQGLLIMTNDLELKRELEDPKNNILKVYKIRVEGLLRKEESKEIQKGVELEEYKTKPCKIEDVLYNDEKTSTALTISIKGGKNREIKRVFEKYGHKVKYMKRVQLANIILDIENGTYRRLKPHEIKLLKLTASGAIKK